MMKQPWKKWIRSGFLCTALLWSGTAVAGAENNSYTVQKGDMLWKIAEKYETTVDQIKAANHLTSDEIRIGQALVIPEKTISYKIQKGDVLWKIAEKYGTTIDKIVALNQITDFNNLLIGQELKIPQQSVSVDSVVPATSSSSAAKPWVEYQTYTVQKGETGWTIALKFGIPFQEFLQLNNMTESSILNIGQKVKVAIHHVPVKVSASSSVEWLDWWTEAQYVFPIGTVTKMTDVATKKSWYVKRTIGANHADSEPLTKEDAAIMKEVWNGEYSWNVRPVLLQVGERTLAASASSMPHSTIEYIMDNDFAGHFDIHFLNSTRHNDGKLDVSHQQAIRVAAAVRW
ncbi:LysM peptidoglycan-binding domain-containing protein [Ammoniphilus resinae]|uniref:LysM repeat protein n=1 Tax=Ammoniphilus resinae TaxID=861532 RepID=A0ABS4GRP1_9BACL|nr:LysM peptidoglycan-binding domain-containing protein [Ammoniphilus resinae]MBP1932904.1 LysM repeat protein [Ammoniphilus resinae]